MTKQAKLLNCHYRSFGPQLQQDVLVAEIEVDGKVYEHDIPNTGWSYNTPALCLMGYLGIQPTDFDGGSYAPPESVEVPVVWHEHMQQYVIAGQIIALGAKQLEKSDWFDPEGNVYNSEGQGAGNAGVEPGTGNQGAVDIETET